MDVDSDQSSDHGDQNTNRLRESVTMAIRQLQHPQSARMRSDEVPESDEEEVEDHGGDDDGDGNDNDIDEGDDDGGYEDRVDDELADGDLDEPPRRRHSVSSVGSQYSPSAASAEADPPALPNHYSLQAEPDTHAPATPRLPPPRTKSPPLSPYSTVPPTPTQSYNWLSPRKRSLSPDDNDPYHATTSPHPFKRHRTAPFNHAYLSLLNDDILSAAARYTPPDQNPQEDTTALQPSQIGLTPWSEPEKVLFFEALARLGPDDAAGIAARVRTKGALEVAAYLDLLRASGASLSTAKKESHGVVPAEIPAAVELSQACCAALEEAADAVSVRQENHEEGVEKRKWGEGRWLVGAGNWRRLEQASAEGLAEGGMGSLGFFRVGAWLRLSERVFMNSVVEEYNWVRVEGERPAIRTTALEDFYALAVQVTRRLVAATIFVGESRVKTKRAMYPETRSRVWKQDVEAAALSLGLPTGSREFWAKCARRLRLDIYDEESDDAADWEGESEREPMSYDEVERALGLELDNNDVDDGPDEDLDTSSEEEMGQDMPSAPESDNGSVELGGGTPYASEYEDHYPEENEAEKEAVTREMNELLIHSTLEYPKTGKPRTKLRNRIRAERAQEAYADKLDSKASYYEEKRLWAMLERQPPMELEKPDVPEEPPQVTRRRVDDLVQAFARTPGDWRSKLEAVPSRWEMEYALVEGQNKEKGQSTTGAESGGQI